MTFVAAIETNEEYPFMYSQWRRLATTRLRLRIECDNPIGQNSRQIWTLMRPQRAFAMSSTIIISYVGHIRWSVALS